MKKRQRKKNWVKAGRRFLIGAVDGRFCLSRHPEFATKAEKQRKIWSSAPEFTRQDTVYRVYPDGGASLKSE